MSKNGPNLSKNGLYPSKHVRLCVMFHIENYLSLEKVIPMDKFANHLKKWFLKETAYKDGYIIGFFNPPEENLPAEKRYTVEWDYYSL